MSRKTAILIDIYGNEVEAEVKRKRDLESESDFESDFESESEEEDDYDSYLTSDDLEIIMDNKTIHKKRTRKKHNFLKI